MNKIGKAGIVLVWLALSVLLTDSVFGNGGPFVLKYPGGDPAAKGVLARLDADLKPGRENRLRVVKEDLKVTFAKGGGFGRDTEVPPLAYVVAQYTIENPEDEKIEVDFGFPILRGIYVDQRSMWPRPDVRVQLGSKGIGCTIISNSAIYGIIRQRARDVVEKAIAADPKLCDIFESVRSPRSEAREARIAARKALFSHLTDAMKWNERDAALMAEYASLAIGVIKSQPPDRNRWGWYATDKELNELTNGNLGPLSAIGEQKATQFFAQLAACFEPKAAAGYEAIFTAWGGDVRERSLDLKTGEVRPREVTVDIGALDKKSALAYKMTDPTIYARVDYLDPTAKITEPEKESCKSILKNLPVVFTFAPMNILHYRVTFPAKSTEKLTVSYRQYAYSDTRSPSSYQLAYVVHPASFWKEFGPINLEVAVPEGVEFRASVPCTNGPTEERSEGQSDIYCGLVESKKGEIYLAVDAETWKKPEKQVAAGVSKPNVQGITQAAQQKAGL